MANSIALIGLLIASQNLSITTSAGLHRFFNLIRVGLAEIIPHNVSQRVLVCARLPFLADPGVYSFYAADADYPLVSGNGVSGADL